MLPSATTYDDTVKSTAFEAELKREMEKLENEAFAFLEMVLESDEDPSNYYDLFDQDVNTPDLTKQQDPCDVKLLEDEGFALLEALLREEDEPSGFDGLFVRGHMDNPIDFPDQQEMERLEEETFEPLGPVLEEEAASNVHRDVFVRGTVACKHDVRPQQWHRQTTTGLDLHPTEVLVNLLPSSHNVKMLTKKEGTILSRMLQRIRSIIGR